MRKAFFLSAAVVLATFVASPWARAEILACTQKWCQEGMTINLATADSAWPAGEYAFSLKLDDKQVTCKGKLPFADCNGAVTCDSEEILIGESGCALPPQEHFFNAVTSYQTPKHVTLSITRPDGKVFMHDADVVSECSFPNGEECDSTPCCSAVSDVLVEWR